LSGFDIPILFLIFNRPDTTQKVFDVIKDIKPKYLFVAGDGPRDNYYEEEQVKRTREVLNQINWKCETRTYFRNKNLGCKLAVSSAIDWFFENVEMGIILEDDCLPHSSFFPYCKELLIKYKDEEKIMQISGFNALNGIVIPHSYYFSKFGTIWGWAAWQRAWKHYDVELKRWPFVKENELYKKFCDSLLEKKWRIKIFDGIYHNEIDTWDYQWSFAKLMKGGLSIIPSSNLVSNIGFSDNATHTSYINPHSNINQISSMDLPLEHPSQIERNKYLDKKFFRKFVIGSKIKNWAHKIAKI
jgi:hypothetical protein